MPPSNQLSGTQPSGVDTFLNPTPEGWVADNWFVGGRYGLGGALAFAWGACSVQSRKLPLDTLVQRFAGSGIVTRYYNPHVHAGAFALPQYVLQAIGKPSND